MRESLLRKLARSYQWQVIYSRSKEVGGICLFSNKTDFTSLQVSFLQLLEIYHNGYTDLALNEDLMSEEVLEDWLRFDSYLLYKREERKKDKLKSKKKPDNRVVTDRIIFRGNRKLKNKNA